MRRMYAFRAVAPLGLLGRRIAFQTPRFKKNQLGQSLSGQQELGEGAQLVMSDQVTKVHDGVVWGWGIFNYAH